ncbi:MAG: transposase [Thermoplasmata archaeon]|nr:MAG: transposase [Thermoplasmata archaeon]
MFAVRGCSAYISSDNGYEFTSSEVKTFLEESCVDTLFKEPGSLWENGYVESFNARMRDELLNDEIFLHIDGMRYVVNRWTMVYNHYRPYSSAWCMTPTEFA